jgi:hypothetical protein
MATKRQQTMAKITRERAVKEKRERKLEKKRAAAAVRKAKADGTWVPPEEDLAEEDPADDDSPPADGKSEANDSALTT